MDECGGVLEIEDCGEAVDVVTTGLCAEDSLITLLEVLFDADEQRVDSVNTAGDPTGVLFSRSTDRTL